MAKKKIKEVAENIFGKFNNKEERQNLPGGKNMPYNSAVGNYIQLGASTPLDVNADRFTSDLTTNKTNTGKIEDKPIEQTEVGRDKSGKITSITLRDGRQFVGLSQAEFRKIAEADVAKWALPTGTAEAGTARKAEEQAQQNAQIAEGIGNPQEQMMSKQNIQNGTPSPLDWKQVRLATLSDPNTITKVGGGIVAGVVAGRSAGAVLGPYGAAAGAVLGAAAGIYSSAMKNIKDQRSGEMTAQVTVLTKGERNIRQLTSLMDIDPMNAHIYADAINTQFSLIEEAHSQLYIDSKSNLNLALSKDGTEQLQKFESFYSAGGGYDILKTKAQVALMSPDFERGMVGLMMTEDLE